MFCSLFPRVTPAGPEKQMEARSGSLSKEENVLPDMELAKRVHAKEAELFMSQ